jgi:type IV pilus assembly protein PilB
MRLTSGGKISSAQVSRFKHKSKEVIDAPVTKLVSSIITGAINARASDIHIEPQELKVRVRYRIDGILRGAVDVPSSAQQEVISHVKILADMDIAEKRIPQDGHITMEHEDKEYDLRVSSLPTVTGEKIVIRLLDKSGEKWNLDRVVTDPRDNETMKSLLQNPYGMFLLTGPTGCGKTTTLYSALQLLNTPERNIVTIEDPVEYCLQGINQIQVNREAGLSFSEALRSVLRQDPDVVLVGEIRDPETAELAVSAALTGHLVLSTLHTNDAPGAVSRLINLGVQPFMVASALLGCVAQRLMRTCCPKCKTSYTPEPEELEEMSVSPGANLQLCRSEGCSGCYHTGYLGRRAIYEILPVSQAIRKLITEGQGDDAIREQALAEGMRTLREAGLEVAVHGGSTFEELKRVVDVKAEYSAGVRV